MCQSLICIQPESKRTLQGDDIANLAVLHHFCQTVGVNSLNQLLSRPSLYYFYKQTEMIQTMFCEKTTEEHTKTAALFRNEKFSAPPSMGGWFGDD